MSSQLVSELTSEKVFRQLTATPTRLEGEWKAGLKNGQGVYWSADGNVFDGDWKADMMEGQGIFGLPTVTLTRTPTIRMKSSAKASWPLPDFREICVLTVVARKKKGKLRSHLAKVW